MTISLGIWEITLKNLFKSFLLLGVRATFQECNKTVQRGSFPTMITNWPIRVFALKWCTWSLVSWTKYYDKSITSDWTKSEFWQMKLNMNMNMKMIPMIRIHIMTMNMMRSHHLGELPIAPTNCLSLFLSVVIRVKPLTQGNGNFCLKIANFLQFSFC